MDQHELREAYFDIYVNVSRILFPMIQEELNRYWEMKACYPECLEKMQEIQDTIVDALATIQKKDPQEILAEIEKQRQTILDEEGVHFLYHESRKNIS